MFLFRLNVTNAKSRVEVIKLKEEGKCKEQIVIVPL